MTIPNDIAKTAFFSISKRLSPSGFSKLVNAINAARGSRVRVEVDDGNFLVREGELSVLVPTKFKAARFQRGFARRLGLLNKEYLLEEIEFQSGDTIVDCGANVGEFSLLFKTKSLQIEYIGFEPAPAEFKCATRNVSNGQVHNIGLWNTDGELEFFLKSDSADSSLIEMKDWDFKVTVACRRLDAVVDVPRIKLMKIEAEGAEPEVLAGAKGLLDRTEWITVDAGPERGFDEKETLPEVVNFLTKRNFDLVRVSHDRIVALFKRSNA